jgi:hypothetical protein
MARQWKNYLVQRSGFLTLRRRKIRNCYLQWGQKPYFPDLLNYFSINDFENLQRVMTNVEVIDLSS